MKILMVEDDPDIAEFVKMSLMEDGYTVDTALEGLQGSYLARLNPYDLIILDYSLPLKNGLEVCAEIRAAGSSVPIIFLSVVSDTKMKIEALKRGADDYLTKPFFFDELKERIKALLRRPPQLRNPLITIDNLAIDLEKKLVHRDEKAIYLTRKEYSLLEYFVLHADMAVSRSMILEHVWNADSDPLSNTVETHILRLRKKINSGRGREFIKNIPGRGYMFDAS